ncbi:hypothetical protein KC19_12G070700 [Ceratodon purpureus]|uniref:Uncharacterized protein n=1 Tax=Ceratodon purpureus TaxID=3225 RepID=A0A8T0G6T3_CERPU|nr:hypothetical protein KC19_12G070700 [Ceratodon purpureus]
MATWATCACFATTIFMQYCVHISSKSFVLECLQSSCRLFGQSGSCGKSCVLI